MLWVFQSVENYFCHSGQLIWRRDYLVLLLSEMFILLFVNTLLDSTAVSQHSSLIWLVQTEQIFFMSQYWLIEKKPTKGRISKEQHMHYLFISLAIVCDPLSWIIFRVLRKKDELKIWYWSRKSQSDLLPDKPVSYEAICYEDTVIFCNKNQILLVHK